MSWFTKIFKRSSSRKYDVANQQSAPQGESGFKRNSHQRSVPANSRSGNNLSRSRGGSFRQSFRELRISMKGRKKVKDYHMRETDFTLLENQEGLPRIYKAKPVMQNDPNIGNKVYKFFNSERSEPKKEITIMLVGASGSGKTTMINSMANYLFGVNIHDHCRFKVTDDGEESGGQNTLTTEISCYTLHYQQNYKYPCTLTIIDTPGFDTGDAGQDDEISNRIRSFCAKYKKKIDCVAFVAQSSQTRSTASVKHVINRVEGLLPDEKLNQVNKVVFLTFSDAKEAPFCVALEEAKSSYKDKYLFNNSTLYTDLRSQSSVSKALWKENHNNFAKFFMTFPREDEFDRNSGPRKSSRKQNKSRTGTLV